MAALQVTGAVAITVAIFCAQFFLWFYNGPVNALIANSVRTRWRAHGFAFSILVIHLFGDAVSPSNVGQGEEIARTLIQPGEAGVRSSAR